jgi:hypothetical protein
VTPRPLVRRREDGTRYAIPVPVPERPRYTPAVLPSQVASSQPGQGSGGTGRQGRNNRARLTDDDVREIRADYSAGKWTQTDLAYIYDVNVATISDVVHRRNYAHVKPTPEQQESD